MKKNSKDTLTLALSIVGGAVAAKVLNGVIDKAMPDMDPKIISGIKLAGGFFLATQKSPMMKGLGYGVMAVGGAELAAAFIPSIGAPGNVDYFLGEGDDDDDDDTVYLNAPADGSILSAPADGSILSERDDYENEQY